MPYTPQTWVDNDTTKPLSAFRMNYLETGVDNASTVADAAIPAAQKGAANGVASLDGTGKVPAAQLPVGSGGSGVSSVNTRTGAVFLAATDVGLNNVNNTADLSKPISTATQTALDGKMNTGALVDASTQLTGVLDQDNFPSGTYFGVDYVKSGGVHGLANAWPGARPLVDTVVAKGPNAAGPPSWLLDGDDYDIVG